MWLQEVSNLVLGKRLEHRYLCIFWSSWRFAEEQADLVLYDSGDGSLTPPRGAFALQGSPITEPTFRGGDGRLAGHPHTLNPHTVTWQGFPSTSFHAFICFQRV